MTPTFNMKGIASLIGYFIEFAHRVERSEKVKKCITLKIPLFNFMQYIDFLGYQVHIKFL